MTNGQIAKFQELNKCHCLRRSEKAFINLNLFYDDGEALSTAAKLWLRRLWHQYRHQIRAMRRNRR
jgi:hypothetical protein